MKTRDQVLLGAFRKFGGVGDNESLDSNQISNGTYALQAILNSWNSYGNLIWKTKQYSVPLTLNVGSYSVGPTGTIVTSGVPVKMVSAQRNDTIAGTSVPVNIFTRTEYFEIPAVTSQGAPVSVYFKPEKTISTLYVWPVPDSYWASYGRVLIDLTEQISLPSAGTDIIDLGDMWEEALIYTLAHRLASEYGVPLQEKQELKAMSKELIQLAQEGSNEEGSIFLSPKSK
jgi:hypothetical protein